MATVPSYRTWTDGEVVTAAMLNSNIRDDGQFWVSSRPRARLRQTAAQSLSSTIWAAINFDVEDVDNDGGHSTSTNTSRYVAQTAGWFLVGGIGAISASGSGQRGTRLAVNGTVQAGTQTQGNAGSAGGTDMAVGTQLIFLNATDYVELQVMQNSGGAINTQVTSPEQSTLNVVWVGS